MSRCLNVPVVTELAGDGFPVLRVDIGDDDIGAERRGFARRRRSDSVRAADDDHDLSTEIHADFPLRLCELVQRFQTRAALP